MKGPWPILTAAVVIGAVACAPAPTEAPESDRPAGPFRGTVASADGVEIAYTSTGDGTPAILLIHGGFADQSFWSEQVAPFSERYRVVTLDLAGHGESGKEREHWTIDAFAEDVVAVVETLQLESVVLVGNSLGGPVGLEAAVKLSGTARGLIAVDTFQDISAPRPRDRLEAFLQALREDFPGTCKSMVDQLLVEGTDAELYSWIENKMCSGDPVLGPQIVEGALEFDLAAAFAAADVPIRAILGEITPLNLGGNRESHPGFDAVVMEGCGHYPMLERPEEFNRLLLAYVEELGAQ